MLSGMQRRICGENLRLVSSTEDWSISTIQHAGHGNCRQPEDVELALKDQLHIVLSTEGVHFLGGDLG